MNSSAALIRLAMIVGLGACATTVAAAKSPYVNRLPEEAKSQSLCESESNRIFVRHALGSACIAYTSTSAPRNPDRAIVFFDGDVPAERYLDEMAQASALIAKRGFMHSISHKLQIRIVRVARLGLDGSSGSHGDRHKPTEILAMNAAIDALKIRLGLGEVVLAGQSRGSMIAAALLTLGRTDVRCAALGSGVYEHARFIHDAMTRAGKSLSYAAIARSVYDPASKVGGIRKDARRRILVLGDPEDARTAFSQQVRFAESIRAAGHHAEVMEIRAADPLRHGAAEYALYAAALCANDKPDDLIRSFVGFLRTRMEQRAKSSSSTAGPATVSPRHTAAPG